MHKLMARDECLVIFPQCLFEFWAVATRNPGPPPAGQNGIGMTCQQASQWLDYFQRRFKLLQDLPGLVDWWHGLVKSAGIRGLKSHDARLVAAMKTYGIARLLTFNGEDFRILGITVMDPLAV